MKKVILGIIIGVILTSGIVYATNMITADNVFYTDANNQEVRLDTTLDSLYSAANRDLTFGSFSINRSVGHTLATGERSVDLSLNKGKYLVTLIWSNTADMSTTDDRVAVHGVPYCEGKLTCTNDCDMVSLGGQRSVGNQETPDSQGKYKVNVVLTCEYYITVNADNTVLTGIENKWTHSENIGGVENFLISAIPVYK